MLRKKMEHIASEFADGKINRAQFNAIYRRYDEQRTIIDTPTLRGVSERQMHGRSVMFGFTYALGDTPKRQRQREPGFEFDTETDAGM